MIKILRKISLMLCLLVFGQLTAFANHIVGGELRMRPAGSSNLYEITLVQIWDQNNLIIPSPTMGGNRDPDATLFIFRKRDNQFMRSVTVDYKSTQELQYQNKACATLRSLSTSLGTYKGNVTLNASEYNDPQGYYIIWERCCRNDDINNILVPGENGMVIYLEFPPVTIRDSSPEFSAPNGQYICSNRPFSMSMQATDADGDVLRYSLATPMRGFTDPNNIYGDALPRKTYPEVVWSNGISVNNIIPGSSPLAISNTGMLTVNADHIGLYVFTVQIDEYRNGKKIGQVRRDFQLLVIDCSSDQPEQPVIMVQSQPVSQVLFCPQKPVTLETQIAADWSYQWQLNGQNIAGATSATIMVQDTGVYSVVKSYADKCSQDNSSENVHVGYAKDVAATISADRDTICAAGTTALRANGGNIGDLAAAWYQGSISNNALPEQTAVLQVSDAGNYVLVLTDKVTGCTGTDTASIAKENLTIALPPSQTITKGVQINLDPEVSPAGGNYAYEWTSSDGQINGQPGKVLTVAPQQETKYTVVVISPNGCSADTSTIIRVIEKMHIPTAFTPNSDGINDTFEIHNSENQIVDVRIYNRWGEVVFQSTGYATPWDGKFKAQIAEAGVYPYKIKTLSGEVNGVVNLIK